jgi:hypothetical protein
MDSRQEGGKGEGDPPKTKPFSAAETIRVPGEVPGQEGPGVGTPIPRE